MKIVRDEEFENALIDRMVRQEFGGERTGVHCTDLYYCLNKQACRRLMPVVPSKHDILLFSLGWASQRWLTGKSTDVDEIEVDGIKVTCDAFMCPSCGEIFNGKQ